MTTDNLLSVSNLNVYYGESHILRNVDLSIPKGQMVCLIGRNGVGKTTFLKTIIGLLKQRSGSVQYDDQALSDQPPYQRARSGIGYVSQGRDIIPQVTVKENLLLGMEALPGGMAKNRHIDPIVFDLFPILEKFLSRKGGDLSGGQQQQLAIARALLGKPKLLLLDEPTEGIQPSIIHDIEVAVKRIMKETGISVLLVEQHLHFVRQSNYYYAMQRGGIVSSGPTESLSDDVVQEFLTV
ncbi:MULTISPECIES: urea ABC transporter ATP-binding subunit UrtE [unclassified Synechococcus]|jgi:urea transport system ATP-binding protein|uniref:urea ABC transporter ATP-binding subunit UrtE n=1 Tax=unclassified Synechococcus TaxID=2626047 RepID=UPI000B97F700|nr:MULTISPECIES: urea ABC transporter ATP-binding subunit UrtE [unclassified Synechococcus]MCP9828463.1 urea ABC transporter ATP-binding subunit UrtE [Synechococcus sp. L2F]MCP9847977.1 urea ABC transporter ATP-binding subunit UrtE [Synechococcus sp. Lug-A]